MAWQVQRMNYSHEALVDLIVANPTATAPELGAVFGRSKEWVNLVRNSDMFRECYARRVKEISDPILLATVEERLQMLTSRSLEVLAEKMARPAVDIPDNLALQAAALGAKGMALGGFSNKPPPPPELPQANRIERLADRLLHLNRQEILDVTFRDSVPDRPGSVPALPLHAHEAAVQHGPGAQVHPEGAQVG